jgi:hypothetical protein
MTTLPVVRAGKAIQWIWKLAKIDPALLPALVFQPYDPPTLPTISIFNPDGAIQVTAATTTKLAKGVYSYVYTTPAGGALGTWTAWLDAIDDGGFPSGSADARDLQKATPAFQLV